MAVGPSNTTSSKVRIKAIDPKGVAFAYIVMPPWLYFENPPVSVLEDGKLVELERKTLTHDEWKAVEAITQYPFFIGTLALIGLIVGAILVITVPIGLIFKKRLAKFSAKHATKEQVRLQIDFVDYVRKNFPEKIVEASALPKSKQYL